MTFASSPMQIAEPGIFSWEPVAKTPLGVRKEVDGPAKAKQKFVFPLNKNKQ
jgi:hypothetical protein